MSQQWPEEEPKPTRTQITDPQQKAIADYAARQQAKRAVAPPDPEQRFPPYDLLPDPRHANQQQPPSIPQTIDEWEQVRGQQQQEEAPAWPLAIAIVLLIASGGYLLSKSTPTTGNLLWGIFANAAMLAVSAAWFGYGVALMVRGVSKQGGNGQTFTGAMVVVSAVAVPYLLVVGGILNLLNKLSRSPQTVRCFVRLVVYNGCDYHSLYPPEEPTMRQRRGNQPKPDPNDPNDPQYQQFLEWQRQQGQQGQGQPPPPPPPQVVYVQQQPPKRRGVGCGGAIILIIIAIGILYAFSSAGHNQAKQSGALAFTVTYKVTGTASKVTATYNNQTGGMEQHDITLPWQQSYSFTDGSFYSSLIVTVGFEDTGSVTCQILVGSKVVKQSTSSGSLSTATCSGFVSVSDGQ